MTDERQKGVSERVEGYLAELDNRDRPIGAVLNDMGEVLINLWPQDRPLDGKTVYVVSSAEDLDFIASGFMSALRGKHAKVQYSCFWNSYWINDVTGFIPDTSHMIAQYSTKDMVTPDELVLIASSLTEYATVASNLSRVIDRVGTKDVKIFVPMATPTEFEALDRSFVVRGFEPAPVVFTGIPIYERRRRQDVKVHDILRRWTIDNFGGYDQAFIPNTILTSMPRLGLGY